jgi:hypothetical protein
MRGGVVLVELPGRAGNVTAASGVCEESVSVTSSSSEKVSADVVRTESVPCGKKVFSWETAVRESVLILLLSMKSGEYTTIDVGACVATRCAC